MRLTAKYPLMTIALILFSSQIHAVEIVPVEEVEWGYLNPARGDKGPSAADLWGDRTQDTASGILLQFPKGFSSPPHIHNITYRGVVIEGALHNDDPNAEKMWLPAGSYWSQPAGEAHITAANGQKNIAYIEIDTGPYLVQPTKLAFDNGERPVNLDKSNLVWLGESDVEMVEQTEAKVAYLWGKTEKGQLRGAMITLPAGFDGNINADGEIFKAVVVKGSVQYHAEEGDKALAAGSYFGSEGESHHAFSSDPEQVTMLYIRSSDRFDIISDE